ncbi:MAG: tetratricopeptide repeat protein, partial [Acidobacteriota bacterium]
MRTRLWVVSALWLSFWGCLMGFQQTPRSARDPQPRRVGVPKMIHLAGRVLLDDGSPPPEEVQVELLCDGQSVRLVSTRRDGNFSTDLGGHRPPGASETRSGYFGNGVAGDARGQDAGFLNQGGVGSLRSAGPGRIDLTGCQFRVIPVAGFESTSLQLGIRSALGKPDVGTITLRRLEGIAGTSVSFNTLKAPPKASKAYEKAKKELSKEKPDFSKVSKELEKAVNAYSEFAAAWSLLGEARVHGGQAQAAREAFERAIAADPEYIRPYLGLARLELRQKSWESAGQLAERLLELNPNVPESHYIRGVSSYYLGQPEPAQQAFQTLQSRGASKSYPMSLFLLGMIQARQGEIPDAAAQFRSYIELAPQPDPQGLIEKLKMQLSSWEEQGLIKPSRSHARPQSRKD